MGEVLLLPIILLDKTWKYMKMCMESSHEGTTGLCHTYTDKIKCLGILASYDFNSHIGLFQLKT